MDVERRIRTFVALRKTMFQDKNLALVAKRKVYQACVLSLLLYGSEGWIPLRKHINKLNSFHHRCLQAVLEISHRQQWE